MPELHVLIPMGRPNENNKKTMFLLHESMSLWILFILIYPVLQFNPLSWNDIILFFLYVWVRLYFPYSQYYLYPLISWWTGEFLLAATNQSYLERGNLNWGIASIRFAFGNVSVEFSGFLTIAGRPIPLLVVRSLG